METEWDDSGIKGRDGRKKKKVKRMRKGKREKVKKAKDEEANGQGKKKGGKGYPGPMWGHLNHENPPISKSSIRSCFCA